ncbi:MAG TPA: glycine hydroxymethyltransferase [Candidatus Ornithospirochaeta avicola]|uniref:Serine hydroxymethyltransferase n=1 Tax=Candidatus Ornithospirochaeta avicola TaxID=2840896 RepID=A0A9D1TN64_9SPIO|nr:glycine hydroxymethyltransferase [Candidatus Ornithospirochaeta avicola]
MGAVERYIKSTDTINAEMINYVSSLELVKRVSPFVASKIVKELVDQRSNLKLIASENYSSVSVQSAMGNLLTDKYAEGFPYHRFYAGCDNVDDIEDLARRKAMELFDAEYAYVQPHSGADANLCAYWAVLNWKVEVPLLEQMGITNPSNLSREDWDKIRKACGNQRILGLDYYSGGHLTHGYRQNVSAQMFDAYSYSVNKETKLLDYDEIERLALEIKPLILLAGYSAYPRKINFRRMAEIAHKAGAVLMVDMAHFAGLVAGKVFTGDYNPVAFADIVTSTTHKTLRGPRGGLILCKEELRESVDKGCPLVIGGPLPHVMAAKALCFEEALRDEYKDYARRIVKNSEALASALIDEGVEVLTGGTDNHLMLLDVSPFSLNGRMAESLLRECGITLNRNALPFDKNGAWYTSGLRIGTPAVTTLGMDEGDMKEIAAVIALVLKNAEPVILTKGEKAGQVSKNRAKCSKEIMREARERVQKLLKDNLLYPSLDLDFLKKEFALEEN